jgi:hypothetical protein
MAKLFARVVGIILLLVGILGFFVPLDGFLDLTFTHNLFHLVTGIILLAVSGKEAGSVTAAKVFGIIYLLVGIVGIFINDFIGMTLTVSGTIIHFVIALIALYVGFARNKAVQAADTNQNVAH